MKNTPKSPLLNTIEIKPLTIFDIPGIVEIEADVSLNPWGSSLVFSVPSTVVPYQALRVDIKLLDL